MEADYDILAETEEIPWNKRKQGELFLTKKDDLKFYYI